MAAIFEHLFTKLKPTTYQYQHLSAAHPKLRLKTFVISVKVEPMRKMFQ